MTDDRGQIPCHLRWPPANHPVSGFPLSYLRPWVGTALRAVRSLSELRITIGSTRLGRDGSPSRPFAQRGPYLHRLNGGLGEPALPKASRCEPQITPANHPVSGFPLRLVLCAQPPTANRQYLTLAPLHRPQADLHLCTEDSTWCCPYLGPSALQR